LIGAVLVNTPRTSTKTTVRVVCDTARILIAHLPSGGLQPACWLSFLSTVKTIVSVVRFVGILITKIGLSEKKTSL